MSVLSMYVAPFLSVFRITMVGVCVCVAMASVGCWVDPVWGQDTVLQRRSDGSVVPMRGKIVQWTGAVMTLERKGRRREIDNDSIVTFETAWAPEYEQAQRLFDEGEFAQAEERLIDVLATEQREWARTIVLSKRLIAQQNAGKIVAAVESFFKIAQADPSGRFLSLAVVPWETRRLEGNAPTARQAKRWLQSDVAGDVRPAVDLVAAAWLANSNEADNRLQGKRILQELATDLDPTISALAVGQLWRERLAGQLGRSETMTEKQIDVWRNRLKEMPEMAQAGPWYTIAQAQRAAGIVGGAVRDYMRVVILFPEQSILAAPALYRAADLLHNDGQQEIARGLLLELKTKYPHSPWGTDRVN